MNLLNGFRNGTVYLSPVSMRTIAALVNSIAVAPVLKGFLIFQSHLSFKIRGAGTPFCGAPYAQQSQPWKLW
jgi:hypothetical protein